MGELLSRLPEVEGKYTENRTMDTLSWLRTGGPAEILFQPAHMADLATFMKGLPEDIPVLPIGVCSNMIIRDGGIRGVVIRLGRGFNGFEVMANGNLRAGSSALGAQVAKKAADEGYDLAFLRTIPGSIGGAIKMNAGCYGVYLADVFVSATAVTRAGEIVTLKPDDMDFSYRHSALPDDAMVVQCVLKAPIGEPEEIHKKMEDALARRAESQPTKERSCGSTFRNPAGFSSTGRADDVHDLKAWKVIEDAGLRGYRLGGAQMSEMHPNFLINADNATSADLEELGELVRKKVAQNSGITLEWEIMRVGEKTPT
ncbi:UDP-N-acetylenolpyruvoylglucosamine reductase [Rhodobacterales bacterium 52_120_T64]|nr:UDP-N-acetylenolpyruvoylglucosamine reductase [Rhodobacterales bacterium 52_120_T64]